MDHLKELINIVNKQKLKKIEVIGGPGTYQSKLYQLYEGIHDGKILTEEDAASQLYNSAPDNINYKKLKYRLQTRLIDTLFFIEKPSYSDRAKALYNCAKVQTAVSILLMQGARKTAMKLAKPAMHLAIKFEFTEIVLGFAKRLRTHSLVTNNYKMIAHYQKIINEKLELLQAESLVENYLVELQVQQWKTHAYQSDLVDIAIQYQKEIMEKTSQFDSFDLSMHKYRFLSKRFEIEGDRKNLLLVCEKAATYFEEKPYKNPQAFLFLFQMLQCYVPLREFEKGEIVANKCLEILKHRKGRNNWMITLELYMLLSFYSKNYQKALDIYENAKAYQKSSKTRTVFRENWKIYEAYIHYFIEIKKCQLSPDSPLQGTSFRLSKFVNDIPKFSSDKRGINIPILIIQILFLLHKKNYDTIIDKVEALDAYCYRYLRKDDTYRSNCFIKMLIQLPKSGFHKQAVLRKTEKYLKYLTNPPSDTKSESIFVEIIPYEYLWDYVINSLEDKHVKNFRK